MVLSKYFSVNPKKAACDVKSCKERLFSKKSLNHSIKLSQQSRDKRDAELFPYFGSKKVLRRIRYTKKEELLI